MIEAYKKELANPETKYHIFDFGVTKHEDEVFVKYSWNRRQFNKVNEGDLFLYRKPQKVSEVKSFYFFGTSKVQEVIGGTEVYASLEKGFFFDNRVLQEDLEEYKWAWKPRGKTWGHFFNQYGMNTIPKQDFISICKLGFSSDLHLSIEEKEIEIDLERDLAKGQFRVEDNLGTTKTRGSAQQVFSRNIKALYGYCCCITGISNRKLLIGAHIVRWTEDKNKRLDPRNGLCLSPLIDKCFEEGLITITDDYKVKISSAAKTDKRLYRQIEEYDGTKISLPAEKYRPAKENLAHHRKRFVTA